MLKHCLLFVIIFCFNLLNSQASFSSFKEITRDSVKKETFIKHLGNGYLPSKYFNFDLRYLIKFNQYEGIRTGIGGTTNENFSKKFKVNGYTVYGFRDDEFKFSLGGAFRLAPKTNTWLSLSYTDDLQETGSTKFLTDGRFFHFFEPRLLNIDLFHRHITKSIGIEHQLFDELNTKTEFSVSNINPTYQYSFNTNSTSLNNFRLSVAKMAFQWNPFSEFNLTENGVKETKQGYPKFTLQYSKSIKNVFKSDFNFSKIDFRTIHKIIVNKDSYSELTLVSGLAIGDTPITHLYHAYPNNITKETVMQRFSVAGLNSFETMYFNEFFSDKFTTIQAKHFFKPFNISERLKPQLVLISRFAIGDMESPEQHENISFKTLKKGYTESGFEINKLLFGFGLSFTYRYGGYHLPEFTDNLALKFTFNVTL
ncbi:DUF5686 family protein [Seonamhaeicola aphaedonensis]|uniref:Surface antigen-like protein n=1 Tax=Seonamhaeicola aphaedonensis TaxID=1461338 RepID=A0A3D9HMH6_9FLAO|nr:DUF5686 family protein [Seonamhaeicola aphaedonensis]RED50521.1 hypothetical protein DFQ02_101554 [Seonamhaeicola aphaedonensis]